MYEHDWLCIDVAVGSENEDRFKQILGRVVNRKPKNGSFFLRTDTFNEPTISNLKGGESNALKKMVEREIPGQVVSVDGLVVESHSINVSMFVDPKETKKFTGDSPHYLRLVIKK